MYVDHLIAEFIEPEYSEFKDSYTINAYHELPEADKRYYGIPHLAPNYFKINKKEFFAQKIYNQLIKQAVKNTICPGTEND